MATVLNVLREARGPFGIHPVKVGVQDSPVKNILVMREDFCTGDGGTMNSATRHLQRQVSVPDVHVLSLEDVGEGIRSGNGRVGRVDLVCGYAQGVPIEELGNCRTGRCKCRKVD